MADRTPIEAKSLDYQEDLPADKDRVWTLLQSYSNMPSNEIEAHLRIIVGYLQFSSMCMVTDLHLQRERGWNIFPYGCIGRWTFLDCTITSSPEYSNILARIRSGAVFLDAGCAFGYVLRQLASDGAPAANLVGIDLRQGFLDLGYELFKDRDTFEGRLLAGDLLSPSDDSLDEMDGKIDIIHAAALFHLFDWEDQVTLGIRLVKFFKADADKAMVVGRQIGTLYPSDRATYKDHGGPGWYRHNLETWQDLWDEIGDKTGTAWRVSGTIRPFADNSTGRAALNFVIHKC